jgi:hypothetical protein
MGDKEKYERAGKKLESKRECVQIEGKERVQVGTDSIGRPKYETQRFPKTANTDDALKRIYHSLFGNKHEGSSPASSSKYKVKKYLVHYKTPDDEEYTYEVQMLLGDGTVDSDRHKEAATLIYQIRRSVKENGDLYYHFCNVVHPTANLQAIEEHMVNKVHAGNLEDIAPEIVAATRGKEKELKKEEKRLNKRNYELDVRERNLRRAKEEFEKARAAEMEKIKDAQKKNKKKKRR